MKVSHPRIDASILLLFGHFPVSQRYDPTARGPLAPTGVVVPAKPAIHVLCSAWKRCLSTATLCLLGFGFGHR